MSNNNTYETNLLRILNTSKLPISKLNEINPKIQKITFKQNISDYHLKDYFTYNNLQDITKKLYFCDNIIINDTDISSNSSNITKILLIGTIFFDDITYYYSAAILKNTLYSLIITNLIIGLSLNELIYCNLLSSDLILLEEWFKIRMVGHFINNDTHIRIFDDGLDYYSIYFDILKYYFNEYQNKCFHISYYDDSTILDFENSNNIIYEQNYSNNKISYNNRLNNKRTYNKRTNNNNYKNDNNNQFTNNNNYNNFKNYNNYNNDEYNTTLLNNFL